MHSSVDKAVIDVVVSWSRAKASGDAAAKLKEARFALPSELLPVLQAEMAEVSAELLLDLICSDKDVDTKAPTENVFGFDLYPKQQERVAAWFLEQKDIAKALGVDDEAWSKALHQGVERFLEQATGTASEGAKPASALDQKQAAAKKILGQDATAFEARPTPGTSSQAGLMGILNARNFGKDKK